MVKTLQNEGCVACIGPPVKARRCMTERPTSVRIQRAQSPRIRYHRCMRIVNSTPDLKALVAELTGAPYLALDTEFMRDQTYWPKLCLIQVASSGVDAIIDPLADGIALAPFYELLKSPAVV